MLDWLDEHMGLTVFLFVVALLALVFWAGCSEDKREAAWCARAWTIARTSADSIAVIRMCEVKDTKTVVVPQTIYIPSR